MNESAPSRREAAARHESHPASRPHDTRHPREPKLAAWMARRSYGGAETAAQLVDQKNVGVSVVLPARGVGDTIGVILEALEPLRDCGLIDELLIVDAASTDGTAALAATYGVPIAQEGDLMSQFGPSLGKGDALWRGLSATGEGIVAFLDTDTIDFSPRLLLGLLGPLFSDPDVQFVKGAFRRPFRAGAQTITDGGGRVTELLARPLINLHLPELTGFAQPLAGEVAARRALLESLPFPVGYGVELAMLIDAYRSVGLDALAQAQLGTRQNRHQPLRDLARMSYQVLVAAERRIHGADAVDRLTPGWLMELRDGTLEAHELAIAERPALATLR